MTFFLSREKEGKESLNLAPNHWSGAFLLLGLYLKTQCDYLFIFF